MVVQHNMSALNTSRQYNFVLSNKTKNMEKLSSGYKINRAADDAAGLAISEKMRRQIRGLTQASSNAQDGISLLQIADGALEEMHSIIQRMNELSVKAANGTNSETDRGSIQDEITNLITELDRISESTEFNQMKLLNGSIAANPITSNNSQSNPINYASKQDGIEQYRASVVVNPIVGSGVALTSTQTTNLNDVLVNSIVPQAVNSFLNTFSAFGVAASNGQISDQIGLMLYGDSSTTLAYVAMKYGYYSDKKLADDMIQLNLSVNTNSLVFNGDNLSDESRTALETTIVHEMMHAFMDDTLTNGMIGATDGVLDASNEFPSWFTEGMAQAAAGGCCNSNDWVNGGLGIDGSSSTTAISTAVTSSANSLSSGSTSSQYGTGYLACMYLGYLAAGQPASISSTTLAGGLNTILQELMDGNSMNNIINSISGGMYASVSDFEMKFGDSQSADFMSDLLVAVGNTGNGGVVSALTASDLLSDMNATSSVYDVNDTAEFVVSSVGSNRNWGTGGSSQTGSSYTGGTGGTGGIGSTGGTGGTGGTGDTGGTGGTGIKKQLWLHIGADSNVGMWIALDNMDAQALGVNNLSVADQDKAREAIELCETALARISTLRSKIGAYVNRLEHTILNLDNTVENTTAAESAIRDTDMAKEMVEYSQKNILAQAGEAILSQTKNVNRAILSLL